MKSNQTQVNDPVGGKTKQGQQNWRFQLLFSILNKILLKLL